MNYHETDCTITHDGRAYTCGGAVVTPDYAIGYYTRDGDGLSIVTDWHGAKLGDALVVASWRTPNSYVSTRMFQVEATIAGITYTGRTAGHGMLWRGKRKAGKARRFAP